MKVVLQRVSQASVTVDSKVVADIQKGLLVLVGIEDAEDLLSDLEQAFVHIREEMIM